VTPRLALQFAIEAADGSADALRSAFAALEQRLGHDEASRLWWAAFAAADAAHT
jgi:hypothetical protein